MEGEVDGDVNKGEHFSLKPKLFSLKKTLKVKHISESITEVGVVVGLK